MGFFLPFLSASAIAGVVGRPYAPARARCRRRFARNFALRRLMRSAVRERAFCGLDIA
jgi:hypothetical protein